MWEVANDDDLYADYDFYFSVEGGARPGFTLRLTIDKPKKCAYVYIKGDSHDEPEIFMSQPATVPMRWAVAMAKSAYCLPTFKMGVNDVPGA